MKNIIRKTACIIATVIMLTVPSLSEASAKMPVRSEDIITDTTDSMSAKERKQLNRQLDKKFTKIGVTPYVLVTEDVPEDISLDDYARKVRNSWHIKTKDALIIIVSDKGLGLCGPMKDEKESSDGIDDILKSYQENAIMDKSVIKAAKSKHYATALKQMNRQDISSRPFDDAITFVSKIIGILVFSFIAAFLIDRVSHRIAYGDWWGL